MTLIGAEDQVAEYVAEEYGGYVLIVGTNPGFLEYYQNVFLGLGFTPLVGTSHESVLASLRLIVFDFIVVAQSRLAFEGRVVTEGGWMHDDRMCVLVITRGNDPGRRLGETNPGAVKYLRDPVTVPEMARVITAICNRKLSVKAHCDDRLRWSKDDRGLRERGAFSPCDWHES